MKIILEPVVHRPWYTRHVEDEIAAYFREAIFGPLLAMVKEAGFSPDPEDQGPPSLIPHAKGSLLAEALRAGRLWYADGAFYSDKFSAAISRELRALGAQRLATGAFSLPLENVPEELRVAVAQSKERAAALSNEVLTTIKTMEGTIAVAPTGLKFTRILDRMVADLDKQFNKTVDGLESVTVRPSFTPETRAAITADFTQSLELPIEDFSVWQVQELRKLVEKNVLEGNRADRLASIIEARYGVAKRKAVFLAGNETSLFISTYREKRYKSLGSRMYKWRTAHDERVRHSHKLLDGKIFPWDQPPHIQGTNRNCNPGEDFNCRCLALPVIEVQNSASILP